MAEDLTGKHFGKWTVLAPSEKPHYYTCQCECGVVKDVYDSSLRLGKSRSCLSCANRGKKPAMTETALRKAKKKEKQIINGWKVLEVLPEKRSGCFLCRAICPKCGKETTVKITRLSRIQHCADCNRDIGEKNEAIHSTVYADGSSLMSICTRAVGGHINKNSTSGANGVCKDCHGRWRAYINFQRKQYHLGSYDTIEEATAARKEAESIIYAPYLKEHEGWEEELSRRLEELKKK